VCAAWCACGVRMYTGSDGVLANNDDLHPTPLNTYSLQVSASEVQLGDTVTVRWNGAMSHPNDWQDWDWVAAFQKGACNSTDMAVGENTCYATDEWAWVSSCGADDGSGSWSFSFDGPGTYEFRISYCGCTECNDVTGDFSSCDSYQQAAVSPPVVVQVRVSDVQSFFACCQCGPPPPIDVAVLCAATDCDRWLQQGRAVWFGNAVGGVRRGHGSDAGAGEAGPTCRPRAVCVLCCAVLCCAVLCCAVLCCAVLCCEPQLACRYRRREAASRACASCRI
jgi:hypothetical protein